MHGLVGTYTRAKNVFKAVAAGSTTESTNLLVSWHFELQVVHAAL